MALPDMPDSVMVKKILDEINMNENDLEEAVVIMKQWLIKSPHFPAAASDDCLLKAFIIACKSVERAKSKLNKYFTYRVVYKDLCFPDRDPMNIDWSKATEKMIMLPGMTTEGYKVILFVFPSEEESPAFSPEEATKVFFMILDSYFKQHYMVSGHYLLFDMSNLSVEIVLKCTISLTSALMKVLTESYPHRIKGAYMFNAPPLADSFFITFLKPFLSTKLKERVKIYPEDHSKLKEYISLEILPSDYEGGKNASLETLWGEVRKRLECDRDWFLNDGSQTVNEDLRPRDGEDEMKGTFRKLQTE